MTDLTPELRKALERVPDNWCLVTRYSAELANRGLIEVQSASPWSELVRRTPAGRAALEQHRG